MNIREAILTDWDAIKSIYIKGIQTNNATFETEDRIQDRDDWFASKIPGSVFVYEDKEQIKGWVILASVSTRCVYAGVAEVSVYVDPDSSGQGIGTALLNRIIEFADAHSIWTIESNMFSTNTASKILHERVGFKVLGIREKLGKLHGQWHDILMMERRSSTIL